MDEQFVLRVPPSLAKQLNQMLDDSSSNPDKDEIDLSFNEDGRTGTFSVGNERFAASLMDLPCVVESYKTYDDSSLVKTADVGQMIVVRESGARAPDQAECRHGLTRPMRDARRQRFSRAPDLNPNLVQRVEADLLRFMSDAGSMKKKTGNVAGRKSEAPETEVNAQEHEDSDSDDSDNYM